MFAHCLHCFLDRNRRDENAQKVWNSAMPIFHSEFVSLFLYGWTVFWLIRMATFLCIGEPTLLRLCEKRLKFSQILKTFCRNLSSSDILWSAHNFSCVGVFPLSFSFLRQTDNFREVRRDFDELNFTLDFTRSESAERTCPRFRRAQ